MASYTEAQEKRLNGVTGHFVGPLSVTMPGTGGGIYPAANGIPMPMSTGGDRFSLREPVGGWREPQGQYSREVQRERPVAQGRGPAQLELLGVPPRQEVRAPGEIVLLQRVMARWAFDDREAARLIGYEDAGWMRSLYTGRSSLRTRDEKDRVRAVLRMATDLQALYRQEAEIRAWLREPKKLLGGASAYDLMMEGSMENLLRLKQFIAVLSGR